MRIIVSKEVGYCFGVKRALKLVEKASKKEKVYTFGHIIHNMEVIKKLEQRGVKVLDNLKGVKDATVVIRAHGISPEVVKEMKDRKLKIIDGTCHLVNKVQLLAKKLKDEGYQVVIIGRKDHPEVIGINGFADDKAVIIENEEQIKKIPPKPKIGVVIQTTQNKEKVRRIIPQLFEKTQEVRIFNTICPVVGNRQKEARELAKKVDLMLVIGGKKSSNTRKLAEISSEIVKTYHIQTSEQLRKDWFKNVKNVGLISGTSTPDFIIDDVVEKLKTM